MNPSTYLQKFSLPSIKLGKYSALLSMFLFGLLLPLSFAPFHFPGLAIVSLAFFYTQLTHNNKKNTFLAGLFFGLGYFGFGISWVFISIHDYGHLNSFFSFIITLIFISYLSLFPAFTAAIFKKLSLAERPFYRCFLFSGLWVLSEYLRATLFTGFPWLLVGTGQFDSPFQYLFPLLGTYGVGFITCFASALVATSVQLPFPKRFMVLSFFIILLLSPLCLKSLRWVEKATSPLTVGVIQANLSMRDKWDERLFWEILERYKNGVQDLLGTQLIVLPESAIPLPPSYIEDFLADLQFKAEEKGSAIILGIPTPVNNKETTYFNNALMTLGQAKGNYLKQHLVPFGEYIPSFFQRLSHLLALPDASLQAGQNAQALVTIHGYEIATLICYELAYGNLLRLQLPHAQWIVSISDDGWFGHSLAMYQQQQMAQILSAQTGRYQILANNDGLSSIINAQGKIVAKLPPFNAGLLKSSLYPMTGITPWVYLGDLPTLAFCLLIVLMAIYLSFKPAKLAALPLAAEDKRRYPYQLY